MEVVTWLDLANHIMTMTEAQQRQPIQCVLCTSNESDIQEILRGVALDTVEQPEIYKCRNTYNNKYCGEDVVILLDNNPFDEDGVVAWELKDGSDIPIYGKEGKTEVKDQKSPKAIELLEKWDKGLVSHIQLVCSRRAEDVLTKG